MRIIVIAFTAFLVACEFPVSNMAATSGSESVMSDPEVSPDWVPEPPFGSHVASYEFFPDSVESTFDSISTAFDTVTWRDEDFLRFTAYGDGWEVPVFTDDGQLATLGMVRPRVEKYMEHFGRLGAGLLSQVPEYGIGLLKRVPRYYTRCPLGLTTFVGLRGEGFYPTTVVLIYPRWADRLSLDYDSWYSDCDDARGRISATGVMLHEFGHVLADPFVGCTAKWRDALVADSARFPSVYARYDVEGYHPEGSRADYWKCKDYPPVDATAVDTIPSGEDVAESFSMWWLTRCKPGDEPVMDALVESWFPNRLAVLDDAVGSDGLLTDPTNMTDCKFPVIAADRHHVQLRNELFKRDTIPDGIIVR